MSKDIKETPTLEQDIKNQNSSTHDNTSDIKTALWCKKYFILHEFQDFIRSLRLTINKYYKVFDLNKSDCFNDKIVLRINNDSDEFQCRIVLHYDKELIVDDDKIKYYTELCKLGLLYVRVISVNGKYKMQLFEKKYFKV